MQARRVDDLADKVWSDDPAVAAGIQPGDFEITQADDGQRSFWMVCPGCQCLTVLALRPVVSGEPRPSWQWDGNETAPTLDPSIHHLGCWHGWLRAGQFTVA